MLGLALGKYFPSDTYTLWKRGGLLRIDGSLKGVKEEAKTMLPNWKYGHFSLLIDTNTGPTGFQPPVYVSHDKQRFTRLDVRPDVCTVGLRSLLRSPESEVVQLSTDVSSTRCVAQCNAAIASGSHRGCSMGHVSNSRVQLRSFMDRLVVQVLSASEEESEGSSTADLLLRPGGPVERSRVKFSNFRFGPVKGWLGSELKETVNGLPTAVRTGASEPGQVACDHSLNFQPASMRA